MGLLTLQFTASPSTNLMKRVIWKFPLGISECQVVEMPRILMPLTVQMQGEKPCLWAFVDPDADPTPHLIVMKGTGIKEEAAKIRPMDDLQYLGTVQIEPCVWHYFLELNVR